MDTDQCVLVKNQIDETLKEITVDILANCDLDADQIRALKESANKTSKSIVDSLSGHMELVNSLASTQEK